MFDIFPKIKYDESKIESTTYFLFLISFNPLEGNKVGLAFLFNKCSNILIEIEFIHK